jgi:hypothetical protein
MTDDGIKDHLLCLQSGDVIVIAGSRYQLIDDPAARTVRAVGPERTTFAVAQLVRLNADSFFVAVEHFAPRSTRNSRPLPGDTFDDYGQDHPRHELP